MAGRTLASFFGVQQQDLHPPPPASSLFIVPFLARARERPLSLPSPTSAPHLAQSEAFDGSLVELCPIIERPLLPGTACSLSALPSWIPWKEEDKQI